MARLEAWAAAAGIEQVWVATETAGRAVAFYQRCGYERVEEVFSRGELVTIFDPNDFRFRLPRDNAGTKITQVAQHVAGRR